LVVIAENSCNGWQRLSSELLSIKNNPPYNR
jgi:hypothetical protein